MWTDFVIADLNGAGVPGTLTKLGVMRTCFTNMLLQVAGGLYTLVLDWNDGHFMWVASGYVQRADVLQLESVCSSAASAIQGGTWTSVRRRHIDIV